MQTALVILLIAVGLIPRTGVDEPRLCFGRTVEGWIEILREDASTKADRRRAASALGCFGPEAKAAAPELIEALRRGRLGDEAIDALISIGEGQELTIPRLIEMFVERGCRHLTGMGTFGYRSYVDEALVQIGSPAVPALLKLLDGPNTEMRVCAAEVLGRIGPEARAAVPSLIWAVEHPSDSRHAETLSRYAVRALGRIGPEAKDALPVLNGLLDENEGPDSDVVKALDAIGAPPVGKLLDVFLREGDPFDAYELAWLGQKAREVAPALRDALGDERLQYRISAAIALAHVEPSAEEAVPVLVEALGHVDDEDLEVMGVPGALARLGTKARAALPALTGLVKDGRADENVLKALVLIDPEGRHCVPVLISALGHEDFRVADVAAQCLGLLGARAKDAVPALAKAVSRNFNETFSNGYDPQVSAAEALARIGPAAESAIPILIDALKYRHIVDPVPGDIFPMKHVDSMAAAAAARTLGGFGPRARAAVPALIGAFKARDEENLNLEVREEAALALGRIGLEAQAATLALREELADERSLLRPAVLIALDQLAPDGRGLAEEWLRSPPPGQPGPYLWLRELEWRAMLLGEMGRTSVEADCLTRGYLRQLDSMPDHADPRDGDPIERLGWWFERLGRLGVGARLAVPRLRGFHDHPDPWARMWAAEALERIAPREEADVATLGVELLKSIGLGEPDTETVIYALAYSHDGSLLAIGDSEGFVRVLRVRDGRSLWRFARHRLAGSRLEFSRDDRELIGVSWLVSPRWLRSLPGPLRALLRPRPCRFAERAMALIRLAWDPTTGRLLSRTPLGIPEEASVMAFASGLSRCAFYAQDTLRFWDLEAKREIMRIGVTGKPILALEFSPDGERLVSVAGDPSEYEQAMRVWDASTGKELRKFEGKKISFGARPGLAFSPDAKLLVASGMRNRTRLWDVDSGRELHQLIRDDAMSPKPGLEGSGTMVFSPDGTLLATDAGSGLAADVWDVRNGEEKFYLPHDDHVHALAFSPDGKFLAIAGKGRTIRLFDMRSGELQRLVVLEDRQPSD